MVNVGDFIRIKVNGSAFNQSVVNTFDYKAGGANNEAGIFLDIFSQEWRKWICNLLSNFYQVHSYVLQVYDRLTYVPASGGNPAKLKLWWVETTRRDGGSSDAGVQNANPLPTFVAASGRKTVTGQVIRFDSRGVTSSVSADTRMRGGCRFSPLTEDQTKDSQGNEFADAFLASVSGTAILNPFATNRANWLSGWRHAVEQLRLITTQATLGGTASTMQMQIASLRGPGNVIRTRTVGADTVPSIYFSEVSSIGVSRYVGKQGTRQQREKFQ